jgi:hypothetical protein
VSWSIGENPLFRPRWNKEGRGVAGVVVRVMKYVDRVESAVLGVELVKISGRLRDALKGRFARRIDDYGFGRALEMARIAVDWGYAMAVDWSSDIGFVRYLRLWISIGLRGFGV